MSNSHMSLVDFYQVHQKLGKNDIVLDVRKPEEFHAGHIKGALNIPVDEVVSHVSELKGYEHVYIHCKRGGRAKVALETLQNAGLNNLVCISDAGMDAWIENGYPVIKD